MKAVLSLIAALLVAVSLSGCTTGATSGDDGPPVTRPLESREQAGNTNPADDSSAYVGRTITVSGPVNQIYADGLFSLSLPSNTVELGQSSEVLVVAPNAQVSEGQVVEVTGTIQIFGIDEAAQVAGALLPADQALELEGRVVLVADEFSATGG